MKEKERDCVGIGRAFVDKVRLESRGVGLRNKSGKVEGFVDPEKPSGEGENRRRNARTSLDRKSVV